MEPWGCFVAEEDDGKIVGAALAVMWGTLGLLGPVAVLTQLPEPGHRPAAHRAPARSFFDENKATLHGARDLSEQPQAPDLLPQVRLPADAARGRSPPAARPPRDRPARAAPAKPGLDGAPLLLARGGEEEGGAPASSTGSPTRVCRGMDVGKEVEIVDGLALGDTLLLEKGRELIGFAIYHTPGVSEAPQGALYVKYLAIDPAAPEARAPARLPRRRSRTSPTRPSSSA